MNKVFQWMMATVAVGTVFAATNQVASADLIVQPGVVQTETKVLQPECPQPKVTVTRTVMHDKVPVTKNVAGTKLVKRTRWVAIQKPIYKLVRKGVYCKKTVYVRKRVYNKQTAWVDKPTMVETRIVEKPVLIERRILVDRPIYLQQAPACAAVAATACSAPVIETAAPACAPAIIERHRHFLRFGLGPILDFGLL